MITRAIRLIAALALVNLATLAPGGDLNPPGAPASTPGPEPRVPITALPVTIEHSGSYVVVANLTLTATDTHGITINASNVTIDLNGHTLTGPGKVAGTIGDGIRAMASSDNITVFNGMIRDFRWRGIFLGGGNNRIWQITADSNGEDGIETFANSVILDNCCRENGATGISAGYASVVRNNSCFQNGDDGIWVGLGSSVTGNACYFNSDDGIYAGAGTSVTENACRDNTGNGIDATNSLVSNNACHNNIGTNLVNTGASFNNYAP